MFTYYGGLLAGRGVVVQAWANVGFLRIGIRRIHGVVRVGIGSIDGHLGQRRLGHIDTGQIDPVAEAVSQRGVVDQ